MWKKEIIKVPELAPDSRGPRSYEECVACGPLVFISGQTGWADNTISTDFEQQARQTFRNIGYALKAAKLDFKDIVTMTVFLTDARLHPIFSKVRREVLGTNLSASATVAINQLFDPRVWIEIQLTAVRSDFAGT
jgi:enamine deaminase RidA (YjgF/YER057c/UK114 family)